MKHNFLVKREQEFIHLLQKIQKAGGLIGIKSGDLYTMLGRLSDVVKPSLINRKRIQLAFDISCKEDLLRLDISSHLEGSPQEGNFTFELCHQMADLWSKIDIKALQSIIAMTLTEETEIESIKRECEIAESSNQKLMIQSKKLRSTEKT